jgi:hypothetical protein
MSDPFAYPPAPLVRRHDRQGYADYQSYRPWLRDEFSFRCVYCLLREQWGQMRGGHAIDHFLPVAQYPDRATDYDTLVYACTACNGVKGDRLVPDATAVLTAPGVWVSSDGVIHSDTLEAARLIELLGLDSEQATEFRMLWLGIIALTAASDVGLFHRLMGFPADLPDLARLRPPGGNKRPDGIAQSYHAQRRSGTLSALY